MKHRINRLTCSIVGVEVVHRSVRALLARSHHDFLPIPRPEPVTRALRPANRCSGIYRPQGLAYASRFMLPSSLTSHPYNAASAATMSWELTTVPCRGNTFSISSLWTSGSRSAHPSSTTMR